MEGRVMTNTPSFRDMDSDLGNLQAISAVLLGLVEGQGNLDKDEAEGFMWLAYQLRDTYQSLQQTWDTAFEAEKQREAGS
jgi:hypothetical protein